MPKRYYELVMVNVEAIQVDNDSAQRAADWCRGVVRTEIDPNDEHGPRLLTVNVMTNKGVERATTHDFIVKHASGEFEVMSAPLFSDRYKRVEEGS